MAEDQDIIRARQARELAKKLADQRAAAVTDPLAELQKSVAESKAQVQAKNIEIPTIALEQAVNTGDATAIRAAATALGQAQGLTGSELRTFSYTTTQNALKGEKPTPPAADADFTYDYVWRQDVGGPSGKWVLVKTPILKTSSGAGGGGGGGGSGGGSSSDLAKLLASQQAAAALAAQQAAAAAAEEKRRQGQSAYDLLFSEFSRYGLGSLVEPLKQFVVDGLSPAEFTLRLRETDAYKKRFAANAQRINKGLRALSEAEYITLEDQYQNVMRNYGLPASYYARGDMGVQQGFEKFIAGDVSAAELEDRIQTAQNRVINAAPEVATSLREFYPEITGGDILAYALDPDKALTEIRRKVGAAEIGAGAKQAGLATGLARAEELQRYGVTAEQARQGFQTIGSLLPRASQLGDIYAKQGMGPFTQTTAEAEIFGTPGAVEAAAKRRKLTELETAQFSGTSGATGGALGRERAGQFQTC